MKQVGLIFSAILLTAAFSPYATVYASRSPWEGFAQSHMSRLRTEDPQLRAIFEARLKEQWGFAGFTLHENYLEALEAYFNTPQDPAETQYVLDTLYKAYHQEPKDWPAIAAALEIAVAGTDEERVVHLCREILESVRDLPDDAGDVVWGASQYLLVKRKLEYVDLVASCVYADVVGVREDRVPMVRGEVNRNEFRTRALTALSNYLPEETKLDLYEKLARDHPIEAASGQGETWQFDVARSIANTLNVAKIRLFGRPGEEE